MKSSKIALRVFLIVIPVMLIMGAILFVPAGTLDFWEGWLFFAALFVPMFFIFIYMIRHERQLLEKRLNVRERRKQQGLIQLFNTISFFASMMIAGFDHRYGWSNVPFWLVIASDAMMLTGYYFFIKTMLHNEYASRVIEIQKGQKLIDTGPYAMVRHPMYAAGIFMYMFIPIALGSFWAMIPLLLIPVMLVFRVLDEEKAMIKGLKGYKQYMKKVKYRLFPGIW
jgi:protein-S-isoprenylcysteine O-methyltransferase Ste14